MLRDSSQPKISKDLDCLDQCAVRLWNHASTVQSVPLKDLAFTMMLLAVKDMLHDAQTFQTILSLGFKLVRAWLDTRNNNNTADNHDNLHQAKLRYQQLEQLVKSGRLRLSTTHPHVAITLACLRAQLENNPALLDNVHPTDLPVKEHKEFGWTYFLLAVRALDERRFSVTIECTQKAIRILEGEPMCAAVSKKESARMYRVLAHAYHANHQKTFAENAIRASIEHCPTVASYVLLVQIEPNASKDALASACKLKLQPGKNLDSFLALSRLVMRQHAPACMAALQKLISDYANDTSIRDPLALCLLDVALERLGDDSKAVMDALVVHLAASPITLSPDLCAKLLAVFNSHSARFFTAKRYPLTIQCLEYAKKLLAADQKTLVLLQRKLVVCLMESQQNMDQLAEERDLLVAMDPHSMQTLLLQFLTADASPDTASEAQSTYLLEQLLRKPECTIQVIASLISRLNRDEKRRQLLTVLEKMISMSTKTLQEQNLSPLLLVRCVLRLIYACSPKLEKETCERLLKYLKKAFEWIRFAPSPEEKECTWFAQLAWNLALDLERAQDHLHSIEFFALSDLLLETVSSGDLQMRSSCLLMATAGHLELSRNLANGDIDSGYHLQRALHYIERYQHFPNATTVSPALSSLMHLFEFECRTRLHQFQRLADLAKTLEKSGAPSKYLERMTSIATTEPGVPFAVLAVVFQVTLDALLRDLDRPDSSLKTMDGEIRYGKFAAWYRCLVEAAMGSDRAKALVYLAKVVPVLDNAKNAYPEEEIKWLAFTAWNCGVEYFGLQNKMEALEWCQTALKIMRFAPTSPEFTEMTASFDRIFSRQEEQ